MSQTSHLKSTSITNLDATPVVQNTSGQGAPGALKSVSDTSATVSGDLAGSTYIMVRVPTNAKMKHLYFEAAAMTAGKLNLSVYYSDSTSDGTAPANQGVIVPTTGDQFFASDIDCASAVSITDVINESGNNPVANRNKPLWDALGLTSDPGGYFDIVAVCHTTGITTGAAFYVEAVYVW